MKRKEIAEIILKSMARGKMPWLSDRGIPTNPLTGQRYSGINVLLLEAVAESRGFRSRFWATPVQWGRVGVEIPVGCTECVVPVGQHRMPLFNAALCVHSRYYKCRVENLNGENKPAPDYERARKVVELTRAEIVHDPDAEIPHYLRFPDDRIVLPEEYRFQDTAQYWSTVFHELAHYSELRIGWSKPHEQGELLAEIVSGYLESELGLPHDSDTQNRDEYMDKWVEEIGKDPNYLFETATYASKSFEWVLGFSRVDERENSARIEMAGGNSPVLLEAAVLKHFPENLSKNN